MAALLGVETEIVHELRAHLDAAISISQMSGEEIADKWSKLQATVSVMLNRKLAEPGDDLFSTIALEHRKRNTMTEAQLTGLVLTLLTAGVLTPIAQITNGLATLLRNRDQYELLVQKPSLIPLAVEEVLRYNSTVEIDHLRVLTDDVEIAGVQLPSGSPVFTSITSANRDSAQFSAPDEFNIVRSPNPHIAFGYGPHACPAASFSRMFLVAFYSFLVGRFPDLQLATSFEDLQRRGPGLHSVEIEQLLVTWATSGDGR
jgi:cytochrome P450